MNCPVGNHADRTGRWNIWEYDMSTGGTARGSPSA